MSSRNLSALIFILASLACLYPGLTLDILTLNVGAVLPLVGHIELYQSTQNILQTINTLFINENHLVAWLILLFSIVVPIAKTLLLLVVLLFNNLGIRKNLYSVVSIIGKWSMGDVFVVGIFMAFLATGSNESVSAILHEGFYYFTAYCILSIIGTQLIQLEFAPQPL